jgi:hypothetical protein
MLIFIFICVRTHNIVLIKNHLYIFTPQLECTTKMQNKYT